jgi:hypothetical protein
MYVHTFVLSGGGLGQRRERLYILHSVLLCTAGLVTGSLHTMLWCSPTGRGLRATFMTRPPVPSVRISARYLDGSMALAWIFERIEHVCSHTMQYLANSLGIYICETNMSDLVDQPLTPVGKKQIWRTATFHCQCIIKDNLKMFPAHTFCKTCAFLISKDNMSNLNEVCPFCHISKSWYEICHPCLACQFATIIYRYPFHL